MCRDGKEGNYLDGEIGGKMKHKGCGGEIYFETKLVCYERLKVSEEGELGEVFYTCPLFPESLCGFRCSRCAALWLDTKSLLRENREGESTS